MRSSRRFSTRSPNPRPQPEATQPAARRPQASNLTRPNEGAPSPLPTRADPRRVVLSEDGRVGRIGSKWWEVRGRHLFRMAEKRAGEDGDAVLETCRLAAAHFDWDQEELPRGARRIYRQIENAHRADSAAEQTERPKPPRRRGRRRRAAAEGPESVSSAETTETAEVVEPTAAAGETSEVVDASPEPVETVEDPAAAAPADEVSEDGDPSATLEEGDSTDGATDSGDDPAEAGQ